MAEMSAEMRRGAIIHEMARRILDWLGPKAAKWYRVGLFDLVWSADGVWSLRWRHF